MKANETMKFHADILLDLEFDEIVDFEWLFLHGDELSIADSVRINKFINYSISFGLNQ